MLWHKGRLDNPPKHIWYEAHGVMCHAHQWLNDDSATIVFIHGAIANNVWWEHIACQISYANILSVNLSGHGKSHWDAPYNLTKHAKEVLTLIEHYAQGKIYLIGHSYGGAVAALVSSMVAVHKVVLVDTPLKITQEPRESGAKSYRKYAYPTMEDAIARFKPIPSQPITDQELLQYIAKHSITKTENGFEWQFDPSFNKREISEAEQTLIKPMLEGALFWYGELSPFGDEESIMLANSLGLQPMVIPDAHHAVMIDNPGYLLRLIDQLIQP